MNKDLQKKLTCLEGLISIQRDFLEQGYMHGMLNGMILAHSIFVNQEPKYKMSPKTRKNHKLNIRHKSNLKKRKQ